MAAYALESAGEAEVTMVLRSNFNAVKQNGFTIDSERSNKRSTQQ